MSKPTRASARPSMKFQFWTADREGNKDIEKWLRSDEAKVNSIAFYACFVNWAHQQVSRVRDPHTKHHSEAAKERSRKVWEVLRERPLDIRAFTDLMEDYSKRENGAGYKLGHISVPEKADASSIALGHRHLKQIVRSEAERIAFTLAEGGDWALTGHAKRKVERARREARAAEHPRKSALGQYESVENAISSIEEDLGQNDASAVVGETETSTKLSWEQELVDRTKK